MSEASLFIRAEEARANLERIAHRADLFQVNADRPVPSHGVQGEASAVREVEVQRSVPESARDTGLPVITVPELQLLGFASQVTA
jgi:hypothetical protein